ncbi:hypothetical protein RO3G_02808 [Rhizopus delemar RA 99-880]|uniref:Uncharacterized protein n=1 Tax=Rhizopus delemar (strain RA 99-880 / ATCC MYA-4621 / FGSC 9543 / NRRL 43880) TaxID=246409 RepID=I1BPH4_RHIO9|nr:hypothetical protein RO3G_02808 [Rhizopus delemar RA 99-880]|eukprot:EIE78104.1 hypothetical protein RO3G_02808 [Rhizopus delemar RA 99-880]
MSRNPSATAPFDPKDAQGTLLLVSEDDDLVTFCKFTVGSRNINIKF